LSRLQRPATLTNQSAITAPSLTADWSFSSATARCDVTKNEPEELLESQAGERHRLFFQGMA